MSRYKAYSEYKDSGVAWLGKIPISWTALSIKRQAVIFNGATPKSEVTDFWDGDISWITPADLGKDKSPYIMSGARSITQAGYSSSGTTLVPRGAVILSSRAPIGTLGIAAQELCTNQGCKSLITGESLDSEYLFYVLLSSTAQLNLLGRGTTFLELSADELGSYKISFPPLTDQRTIAAFLDHETAKIDALIEKQQRLIELLKEKRQAVISHAVTKGLNPNAPLKDSGVEWLGEVPAHWVVARYKVCTTRVIVGIAEAATHAYAESGVPIIRSTNIQEEGLNQEGMLFIKKDFAEQNPSKYLYKNDVVTVRTGYPGTSAVVPEGLDQSHCFTNLVATPRAEHHSQFLAEYLNSYIGKKYFELHAWGSAQKNISVPILQDFPIAFPGKEEEEGIVQYIFLQKQEFSRLIALAESSIQLMQERRTALISAAVTGKIDVRDWQAAA
jgi:type I restriction enzyme S subunit